MKKCCDAGYLIGLHFDPMIYYEDWKNGYRHLLDEIFSFLPIAQIAWISIGSLRFNPEMKDKMELNYPKTRLTTAEMVLGKDGKMRYVKPIRLEMYAYFYKLLQEKIGISELSPVKTPSHMKPIVYFCMERWDVWESIMGDSPRSIGHLDYLFAKSLRSRYQGLGIQPPDLSLYEKYQST